MKIKQLIKKLSKLNPETEVILSSDSEGNWYGILSDIYISKGLKYRNAEGEIEIWNKDDTDEYFSVEDYNKCKDCIVLYPN